ncbi:hypothetical protein HYT17_01475 [Candidatus Microgenomates bacterium]|nr:hypothetical protein [Candidatus Microgenomates bacterium]
MNRNILIAGGVIIVVGILAGFWLTQGKKEEKAQVAPTPAPVSVELLAQEEISVTIAPGANRQYTLTIDKIPEGVTSLSYEITYDTKNKGTQGIVGSPVTLKSGQSKYINDKLTFGTCSRNKCVYDEGVTNIQANIRFIFQDGSEKGWKGTLSL